VKVLSPEMFIVAAGPRVSCPGSQQHGARFGECVMTGRGLSSSFAHFKWVLRSDGG
jgi:hypothetical protein